MCAVLNRHAVLFLIALGICVDGGLGKTKAEVNHDRTSRRRHEEMHADLWAANEIQEDRPQAGTPG